MRKEEEQTLEDLARIFASEKQGKLARAEEYLESQEELPPLEVHERFERAVARVDRLSDEERESPDLYGAERLFLEFFVTEQMAEDFHLIARDFLDHERQNLENYHELKYVEDFYNEAPPEFAFQNLMLNMMYSAYKSGNAFAREQFRYLYKRYYKKEYNQFKRFHRIELDYLTQFFLEENTEDEACLCIARVLTMGRIFDMEIADECLILIAYLDELMEDFEEEKETFGFSIEKEQLERAGEILLETFGDEETLIDSARVSEVYTMLLSDYFSLVPSYIFECEDLYFAPFEGYRRALAMYMDVTEKEEFSQDEIHLAAALYRGISVLADNADEVYNQMLLLTAEPPWRYDPGNEPLYDASRILSREEVQQTERKAAVVPEEERLSPQKELSLSEEIERLREKVHALEQNEKGFLETLAKKDRVIRENEMLLEKYKEEHEELAALRDHVYRLTESDEESQTVSLEEMSAAIAPRRIVIVGGHDNWVNKLRTEFPDWSFISREASGITDKDIVKNAEMVYFFTDTLSHSVYYKYMNLIREGKVPFGYIHGVNMQRNVEQIYKEMAE